MLVGSGLGVSVRLRTLSIKDPMIPLSSFSIWDKLFTKLLEPLNASTALWIVALSVEDTVFEFNSAGAVSEKITVQSFEAPQTLESGPVTLALRLKNEGSVHLRPVGFVFVKNWLGNEIDKLPLDQTKNRIIPGTTRLMNILWSEKWLFGKYTANFAGIYGTANEPLAASVTFWVIPWRILSTALFGILILGFITWKIRKRISLALSILFKGQH